MSNYIDNALFLQEMTKYKQSLKEARKAGKPDPRIPEYVGECFMKIAERFSRRANFVRYTFRDEMIGDAIENCIQYAHNFDPEKSSNPFAYFSQIVYYAFLRRIQKEKKQLYVKYKSAEMEGLLDPNEQLDVDGISRQFEMYDNIAEYIQNFENAKKAKKQQKTPLDEFFQESNEFVQGATLGEAE